VKLGLTASAAVFDRLYKFLLSKLEELLITNLRIGTTESTNNSSALLNRHLSNEEIAHVKAGVLSLADKMKFDFSSTGPNSGI